MNSYYKSNKFKEVLKNYEDFLASNDLGTLTTDDFADVAQYYHEQHNDVKAIETADKALELFPGSVAPLAFLSRYALLEEHSTMKADDLAEKIEDKHDPDYFLLKAEIMIVDERIGEADEYLENAYEEFYDDDYYDDMPLDVATLFIDYSAIDFADKWLQRSDETEDSEYIDVKAKILMAHNDLEASKKLIDTLINRDPYSTEYWNLMTAVDLLAENYHDAVTSSAYALAIDPDNRDAILNKGNGVLGLGNSDEATRLFKRYAELEPEHETGYFMVAMTLLGQEHLKEAKEWFEKALKVNRASQKKNWVNRAEILFQLAYIENSFSHYAKAHAFLDELAEEYKDNLADNLDELGMKLAEVDCAQGHVYLEEFNYDKAVDWFEQAVSDSDGDPEVFIRIAVSAFECFQLHYAYDILHQVIYQNGIEDEKGLRYLSYCCKLLEKKDEETWALNKLSKLSKPDDNSDENIEKPKNK